MEKGFCQKLWAENHIPVVLPLQNPDCQLSFYQTQAAFLILKAVTFVSSKRFVMIFSGTFFAFFSTKGTALSRKTVAGVALP